MRKDRGARPFNEKIGKKLRECREKSWMTVNEVVSRLDPPITRVSLYSIENGKTAVGVERLLQLAVIYGCPHCDIIPKFNVVIK